MNLFFENDMSDVFLGVKTTADLNKAIDEGKFDDLVRLSEAYYDKRIVDITERIVNEKKRIVLIAGPSSSGKTTFAKKICTALEVSGKKPLYLGTDDYFVEREDTPRDENGKYNFEDLDAVDVDLFNRNMVDLLDGKEADLPSFDFITGHKSFGKRITKIDRDDIIVIEGIHALNDLMTPLIKKEDKFKIFICPITKITTKESTGIEPIDHRMLRRMSRDYLYRNHSARDTILAWPSVRAGEERNIFPFVDSADEKFNTSHIYEIPVLKKYTWPLLESIKEGEEGYEKAQELLKFLEDFEVYNDEEVVPNDSILREFIGGSIFNYDEEQETAKTKVRLDNYKNFL